MAERLQSHSKQAVRPPSRPSSPYSYHILLTHSQQTLALQSSCPHSPHSPNNPNLAKHQHLTHPLRPRQAPTIKYSLLLGLNDHMSTFVCTTCRFPLLLCVAIEHQTSCYPRQCQTSPLNLHSMFNSFIVLSNQKLLSKVIDK